MFTDREKDKIISVLCTYVRRCSVPLCEVCDKSCLFKESAFDNVDTEEKLNAWLREVIKYHTEI